eukprot:1001923-Amphidinium_carterae.1
MVDMGQYTPRPLHGLEVCYPVEDCRQLWNQSSQSQTTPNWDEQKTADWDERAREESSVVSFVRAGRVTSL